jgi:hypothetical protein
MLAFDRITLELNHLNLPPHPILSPANPYLRLPQLSF